MVLDKRARIPSGSRQTDLYTPIPGINLGLRYPSAHHEAGACPYHTPPAQHTGMVAASRSKLNMLYILLAQERFWQIKGEQKQPPGPCGEAPPLSPHPHPASPVSGASCSHRLTRIYNSIIAPVSTNSSYFLLFPFLGLFYCQQVQRVAYTSHPLIVYPQV